MSLRDRLTMGNSLTQALIPILDELISAVNALSETVFVGENPHKVSDSVNTVTVADPADDDLDDVADLEHALDVAYVAHIGSTTYHSAADTTNTLTATTTYAKVKALADDLKTQYNAHHVFTSGSVHAGSGDANTVTAAAVSNKATAITLLNDIKTMFNLHCANVTSCHGAADTTNPCVLADLTSAATWSQIQAMADDLKTKYAAHRVLTAGSVHGGADSTNAVTAGAVGSVQTVVNAYLTELKADLNAHMILLTSHYVKDDSMKVTAAAATTLATSVTLAAAIKAAFNDHISMASEAALTVSTLDELA